MRTDDERREVARRLRSISGSYVTKGEYEKAIMLKDGCDELERLADLIEPEPERTCRIVRVQPGWWECDACGLSIRWDLDEPPHVHYCPNCGAKVVDDD